MFKKNKFSGIFLLSFGILSLQGVYSLKKHDKPTGENKKKIPLTRLVITKISKKDIKNELSQKIIPLSESRENAIENLLEKNPLSKNSFFLNSTLNKNNIYCSDILKNAKGPHSKLIDILYAIFNKFNNNSFLYHLLPGSRPLVPSEPPITMEQRFEMENRLGEELIERIVDINIAAEQKKFLENKENIIQQWWADHFPKLIEDGEKIFEILSLLDEGLNFSVCNPYFATLKKIGVQCDTSEKRRILKEWKKTLNGKLFEIYKQAPNKHLIMKVREIRKKMDILNIKLYLNEEYFYTTENKEAAKENIFQNMCKNIEKDVRGKILKELFHGRINILDYVNTLEADVTTQEGPSR